MSEKEFVNQFLSSCSKEELMRCRSQLLAIDEADKETIDELFDIMEQEQKSHFDRADFLRILINYICTTGNTTSFIMDLFKDLLRQDGCTKEAVEYAVASAYKQARVIRENKYRKMIRERKRQKEIEFKREEA